jgi:uncharacterized membrane protein
VTKRNYFQSAVIFAAALWFLKTDLRMDWIDALVLILLAIVCVLHTIDIREDWEVRKMKREKERRQNGDANGSP